MVQYDLVEKPVRITFVATPEAKRLLLAEQYRRRGAGRVDWSMESLILDAITATYGERTASTTPSKAPSKKPTVHS